MKILQIIPYFVPAYSYGGPLKACLDTSRELVKRGYAVTVVTTDTLDGKSRIEALEEEIEGISVIRFKNISNWLAKSHNGYLPLGFFSWMKKNIKNYDLVYCHDFFTYQNIITSYFCKKNNIPFIIQPHGTLSAVRQEAKFKNIKKLFLNLFNDVLENSKNIVALTENEKKEIITINSNLEKKLVVIPNGINPDEFKNIAKINLHEKYNLPKENKIIGYFGRLQHIKGIDISLEILAELKDKINFTYLIIGPDEGEKEKLEQKISALGLKENVIFAGILNGQEKLQTVASCDLFLFTSRNEGLPMTILEIAALGVPQIISRNCNVPEIEKFQAGFELDLTDKQIFAAKILELVQNKSLFQSMSVNAKKMIAASFNFDDIMKKVETILQ